MEKETNDMIKKIIAILIAILMIAMVVVMLGPLWMR
jgi:hypothetical protein